MNRKQRVKNIQKIYKSAAGKSLMERAGPIRREVDPFSAAQLAAESEGFGTDLTPRAPSLPRKAPRPVEPRKSFLDKPLSQRAPLPSSGSSERALGFPASIPGGMVGPLDESELEEANQLEGTWDFAESPAFKIERDPTIAPPMMLEGVDYSPPRPSRPTRPTPAPESSAGPLFGKEFIFDEDETPPEFAEGLSPEEAPDPEVWKARRRLGIPRKSSPPPPLPVSSRSRSMPTAPEMDPLEPPKPLRMIRSKSRQNRLAKIARLLRF